MNKMLKIAAVASIGLLLTGCGGKKITCSHTSSDSYYGEESEKLVYEFDKEGKVTKVTETISMEVTAKYLEYMDDEYDEDLEDALEDAEEECEEYEDADFISCKATLKGRKITQTRTIDLKDLDEDDLEEMYDDDELSYSDYHEILEYLDSDYDDIKKDAADNDNQYSCK